MSVTAAVSAGHCTRKWPHDMKCSLFLRCQMFPTPSPSIRSSDIQDSPPTLTSSCLLLLLSLNLGTLRTLFLSPPPTLPQQESIRTQQEHSTRQTDPAFSAVFSLAMDYAIGLCVAEASMKNDLVAEQYHFYELFLESLSDNITNYTSSLDASNCCAICALSSTHKRTSLAIQRFETSSSLLRERSRRHQRLIDQQQQSCKCGSTASASRPDGRQLMSQMIQNVTARIDGGIANLSRSDVCHSRTTVANGD